MLMALVPGRGKLPPLSVRTDLVAGAIAVSTVIMFLGTGGYVSADVARMGSSDGVAVAALFLNIALILFSWRRYREARNEMLMRTMAEEQARKLSSRDQLTNLLLRHAMAERAADFIGEARAAGNSVAMLTVNLDRFRNVNEVYGHVAGDSVLRSAAAIIAAAAPEAGLCARIGADEFCVAVSFGEGRDKEVSGLADHMARLLAQPFEDGSVAIHISASIGIARIGPTSGGFDGVLRRANIAMTAAKKQGGNRSMWFDTGMESVLRARTEVEAGLRRGIPLGEFVPYYQPLIDLASGSLRGFEALARWNHPAGGVVGADVFIHVAEETDLIGDLFESICTQALVEARSWDSGLTVAVNVSPGQLKDPWLAHKLLKILAETGFPAERLEVEITESSLFENLALAQAIVASLKNQGVRLALDDFGTGYSSLAVLRALPFDRIKIDRSFVKAMDSDTESLAIVTAIARMGDSLGVPVTAEGIETEQAADHLRAIGCDMGQGWLYGRPISAAETRKVLAEKGLLVSSVRDTADDATDAGPSQRRAAA
jgi:diguanylate cyclase (GGDEF)-like protein